MKVLDVVLIPSFLEPGTVRKLSTTLNVLYLNVAERLAVSTETHYVVWASCDESLGAVQFHIVPSQQAIEKQLCHCALVRRFDKLITVGLRPLLFGRLLELFQHRISTVLLLHKVGHVLA